MMRLRLTGFLGLAVAAAFAITTPVQAQQGTITGRVVDGSTRQPLAQAQVQVIGGGASSGALAGNQGNFSLSVSPGSYSIAVVLLGYETARVDGVEVSAGQATSIVIEMTSTVLEMNPISVTVTRGLEERAGAAPAQVNVAKAEQIEEIAATTPVDYVKAMPGVDVIQTGISQSNTVTRGFNNVFSGAMLVLSDYRYATVPSLRFNAYNMIPSTPLDIERVEVVLGPAAALYGPNSANGVMHMITSSPIDKPGTSVSLVGGSREIFQGVFRQAWAFSERSGLRVSGQYFRGNDFEFQDAAEAAAAADNPGNPKIGQRDFSNERWGGEIRYDLRPWEDSDDGLVLTYGLNNLSKSIEMTGIGAGIADDWRYQFGQARFTKGRLFAQAFYNKSSAGGTYLLRTGQDIIDNSTVFGTQLQYGFMVGDRVDLIAGLDYSFTTPDTEGTITGSNEDIDQTTEVGGYLHGTLHLSDRVDFVGALRVDDHEHLADPVYSPRAALVFEPADGHNFRATYNRAFGTPSTNNLFLDIVAGRIPITPTVGYNVRTFGVPTTGFTWNNTCTGGVQNFCMYSPFAPGTQLPANGAALWDGVIVPLALTDPTLQATLPLLGLTPELFATIVGSPQPGDLTSYLLRFNSEDPTIPFLPDPGVSDVSRMRPTITNSYELGYNGLIGGKLRLAVAGYYTKINDFVGPLRVESPNVFLDGTSVGAFLVTRLTGAGVPLAVAQQIAGGIAPTAAMVPLGTVVPDQRTNSDLVLTYRNFGDVEFYGADLGFELHATDKVTLTGSYSWVSDDCHHFSTAGDCGGARDIALNAPKNKGSLGMRYSDLTTGVFFGGRVRYSDAFPMNSGVFVGDVDQYSVVDLNMGYRIPGYRGFIVSLTVNNAFNNLHQESVGAPEMGRIALLKLQYEF